MIKEIIAVSFAMGCVFNTSLANQNNEEKPLYWVAPMNADYKRDRPGKSPMGMDLVPVYSKQDNKDGVTISPTVVQNLGVRTAIVRRENLPRIIDTVGYVRTDENNIEHIHSYEKGWIRKLYVKETGKYVQKGQVIMAIYSPELIYAQQELILGLKNQAIKNRTTKQPTLDLGDYEDTIDYIGSAKLKLTALGISDKQIARIIKNKKADVLVDIEAPISGVISKLEIREGMYVSPAQNLLTIENLSKIWVIAEVYSKQSQWVKVGQDAKATFDDLPNEKYTGKVQFISPIVDPVTRTLQVRLAFDNSKLELKPNMFANVQIQAKPREDVLTIPREALIRSGNNDHVILDLGKGEFIAQEVKIGIESEGKYEIVAGLKAGDKVVTSAQFLIDSESNVSAGMRRITTNDNKVKPAVEMGVAKKINSESSETITGMGVIVAIDLKEHRIKLKHKAIQALNWPAMTMYFKASKKVDLLKLKIGESIHFTLLEKGGEYYIQSIMLMSGGKS